MAIHIVGARGGYHRAAGGDPESELHRGEQRRGIGLGRAAVRTVLELAQAVDDRRDPGYRGRIGNGERVVTRLAAAGAGTIVKHRSHCHHPGVGRDRPGDAGGGPDHQPGYDAGQRGGQVHQTAAAGPECRADGDVPHGLETALAGPQVPVAAEPLPTDRAGAR